MSGGTASCGHGLDELFAHRVHHTLRIVELREESSQLLRRQHRIGHDGKKVSKRLSVFGPPPSRRKGNGLGTLDERHVASQLE